MLRTGFSHFSLLLPSPPPLHPLRTPRRSRAPTHCSRIHALTALPPGVAASHCMRAPNPSPAPALSQQPLRRTAPDRHTYVAKREGCREDSHRSSLSPPTCLSRSHATDQSFLCAAVLSNAGVSIRMRLRLPSRWAIPRQVCSAKLLHRAVPPFCSRAVSYSSRAELLYRVAMPSYAPTCYLCRCNALTCSADLYCHAAARLLLVCRVCCK